MRIRGNWSAQLSVVFGVIVASFVAATLFTQWQLVTVGQSSREIADNYAPSIERLATARGEMRRVQLVLREYIDETSARGTSVRAEDVDDARTAMHDAITSYLVLPADADEKQRWVDILRDENTLNVAVERCLAATEEGNPAQAALLARKVSLAADGLGAAITRDIELNASRAHQVAVQIRHAYQRARYWAVSLAIVCVAIAIGGAVALRRGMRAHVELAAKHAALVEARASELEEFAGRVAHDILSPLNVVGLALSSSSSPKLNDAMRTQFAERGTAGIKRIDRLVTGLLSFAVAGAQPEEGSEADVGAVIADLEPELRAAAAERETALVLSVDVTSPVACNVGVLTSIVSNLARNAIKYIGSGPTRRIDIRVTESRKSTRIEVEDTGPGLAADLEPHVFEPYVRGKNAKVGGIGLGLATVKRIVTAHGGSVGVNSVPGEGCTFWVELPQADMATAIAHARATAPKPA